MKNDWKLKEIRLQLEMFGKDKDKYVGSIHFENRDRESFRFKIRPDMAQDYIDLISEEIVKSADSLGEKLKQSLSSQGLLTH